MPLVKKSELSLAMRLRIMWHNMTHKHATAKREGVATIELCTSRFSRSTHGTIFFPEESGLEPIVIHDLGYSKTLFLTSATTPLDLRRRAVIVGGEGVKR